MTEESDNIVVSKKFGRRFRRLVGSRPRKILALALVLGLIGGGVFAWWRFRNSMTITNICSGTSSSNIALQAAPLLTGSNISQLKKIVDGFKEVSGYEQDSNCLYIATVYYINISDITQANHYLGELTTRYSKQPPLQALVLNGGSLKALQDRLSSVQAQFETSRSNFTGVSNKGTGQ